MRARTDRPRLRRWIAAGTAALLVAAGAVVTTDVPAYALVVGVPARRIGWVGRAGARLVREGDRWRCPTTGSVYQEHDEILSEVDE